MALRLRVIDSSGQGRIALVDGDVAVIGRDPDCDVVLDSIFVSRFHARLCRNETGYEVTDLDSRNGVLVDDELLDGPTVLPPGGSFTVGPFEIRIVEQPRFEQVTQPFMRQAKTALPLVVDIATHEVLVNGAPIRPRLSRLEFRLAALLSEAGGAVCDRESLGDAIWGEGQWDLNMLHRLIHRLKEKIEPAADQPRYIITVPGVGYRLEV